MYSSSLKIAAFLLATSIVAEQASAANPAVAVAPAEQQRVIGRVIDADGEAVIGAHILIKGYTGRGTATDINGQFSLNVSEGTTLEVSYLGYHSIEVKAKNGMTIKFDADQRIEELNEVVVQGVKAQKNAPFAMANIDNRMLDNHSKTGKELPMLFTHTPGVIAWGENGLGTGSVYMRMRGASDSRINVTLDGVPLNSPEDQCVFWANMNSYGSLLGNVQIQRGVGTSTNGDGAFGGTIALTSKAPSTEANGEFSASYGSYNTFNVGGNFSTGLMGKHWILDGAYHETNTDGYMHGTSGRSGSYYGGLTYLGDNNIVIRYKNFGNFEKTGQAWNGLDTHELLDWNYGGMGTNLRNYKDFYNAGLGKYNSLYEHLVDEYDPSKGTERYTMRDGSYWDKTTDNFWQNRSILSMAWMISEHWNTTASLHYTHGYGYYSEFRYNNKLSKFGLDEYVATYGKKSDFVRKKGMTQDNLGLIWNINYKNEKWDVIGGLSVQDFWANHFGYLTYVGNEDLEKVLRPNGKDYKYYDSDANKFDGNVFVKGTFHINDNLDGFGDLQFRHVGYKTDGINDKFDSETGNQHVLDIDKQYNFFNPKAGLSWHNEGHLAFASVAYSNREPERNNFTDNGNNPAPTAESVFDTEIGYNFSGETWTIGANLYYMNYKDQFIKTGAVSDIGEALTTNIDKSYRMGIELTAAWNVTPWLTIEGNAALSQNKIKDFDEIAEDWDNGTQTIHYDETTIAFSPAAILNGFITYHHDGFQAIWHTDYVSKQYLDNTVCDQRSLPCFSTSDLQISYTWKLNNKAVKAIELSANVSNIFNRKYAASGWVYSAIYASGGNDNNNRYTEIGYIPQAGTTSMGCVTLKF